MGYTHDCQSCQPGYMWQGVKKCVPIPESKTTCGAFFKSIENALKDPQSPYYSNAVKFSKLFSHTVDRNTPAVITVPKDDVSKYKVMTYARCSPYVNQAKPYTYGQWFKITVPENTRIVIEVDKQWTTLQELYLQNEAIIGGNDYAISLQEECIYDIVSVLVGNIVIRQYCTQINNKYCPILGDILSKESDVCIS